MKTRLKAIICSAVSLFLCGIGIQKFYLGQIKRGVLYVLFFWTGIPYLLCVIDLLKFIFMTDETFNLKYNQKDTYNNTYIDKELDENKYDEVYRNRFDNAVDAEYSYVDKNDLNSREESNKNNNENTEDELICRALNYYDSINEAEKLINDYEFAANVKHLNALFKSIIDKAADDDKESRSRKELDKMLDYNIPTILKLINSYVGLSSSRIMDSNNIKSDIKESVAAVTEYLKRVLENIHKDDIIDIASDIDVLKSTLKKGGYI